ncbi:MAG: ribosome biogenesis factor YjgA [Burkholderiaceae bacterium]
MNTAQDDIQDDDDFDRPSKTQKKRESHVLQSLGEDLLTLPMSRLEPLNLPEILLDAVKAAKKITNFEGRRRQMQYIGKLMRKVDSEPIREAVAAFKLGHAKDSLALHQSERWRERLLAGDAALQEFIAAHADCDIQQLRSLVRAARKDAANEPEKRSGRAFRELFQFIKAEQLRVSPAAEPDEQEEDGDE